MFEQLFIDVLDNEIVLTDSVKDTILQKHPEVEHFFEKVEIALIDPDEIRQSIRDERVVLYYRYDADVLDGKWIVVVVKRINRHFVSTIYATDQIKSGEVLWTKTT